MALPEPLPLLHTNEDQIERVRRMCLALPETGERLSHGEQGLIEQSPATFFRPPYVGARGWVGIELGQISDADLAMYIGIAWDVIAPARLRATQPSSVSLKG